ncbi:MAG: S9 family peptidase [Rickettsiales bacterium]|nr:S9 family peptidase [Rickettsiales bacterium]
MLRLTLIFLLISININYELAIAYNNREEIMKEDRLIPREVLFGNPDKIAVRMSEDGKYISYLAPLNGVLNVFVAPVDNPLTGKAITADTERGIRSYSWAKNSNNIIYSIDNKGDENFRLYSIDINTKESILLTPKEGVRASVIKKSKNFPDEILVQMNKRVPEYFDIYKINVKSGKAEIFFENKEKYLSFIIDDNFKILFAYKMLPTGEGEIYSFKNGNLLNPQLFQKIKIEDMLTTSLLHITADGKVLYAVDSSQRDKSALFEIDLSTQKRTLLYEDARADIDSCLVEPITKKIQAVSIDYLQKEWVILDPQIKEDIKNLSKLNYGTIEITSRVGNDNKWIVVYMQDDGPYKYYLYDRVTGEAKFLFVSNSKQESYSFAKMHPVQITSRDGLELVSYLTLPRWLDKGARLEKPIPLVLYVHGGPNSRDNKGYNATHQWLANRGYAVLSVNYRGSTGFGKSFINAGDGQWARKMQDDLEDAVKWAIDNNIAEKDKIVIMGGSYGGYATLVGMSMTPELYAAGIDIVGPSNLETLMNSIPPYWKPVFAHLKKIIGASPDNEEGKKFLFERSPLNYVKNIKKPLLIVQGAHDPRVKKFESDQIVSAMKKHGIPVVYLLYKDEGHGLARPENRMAFYAHAEVFLANILKGRYLGHDGNFPGSSMEIIEGKGLTWTKQVSASL